MSRPVIRVEGLSKEYVIGAHEKANKSFREMLGSSLAAPFHRFRRLSGHVDGEQRFWALKDVSFEVHEGEVVGIIGRNGAGKSTMLKILSRITAPTNGRVEIHGRVASLLEVGTGFHPELTGRENIYLNGTILGMSRVEITRKFEEIVAYAEIGKFLDTPVKRYSSGMHVRLAFAVAAHLEPDVLLVDEVLAVGDAQFQKKSLGTMKQSAKSGRTVFFVSHNMSAIRSLCDKCILLDGGRLLRDGVAAEVIGDYLSSDRFSDFYLREPNMGRKHATLVRASILRGNGLYSSDTPALYLGLEVWAEKSINLAIDIRLKDRLGIPVAFGSIGSLTRECPINLKEGRNTLNLKVMLKGLALGDYCISIDLSKPYTEYYDRIEDCLRFRLDASMVKGEFLNQEWGYGSSLIAVEKVSVNLSQLRV